MKLRPIKRASAHIRDLNEEARKLGFGNAEMCANNHPCWTHLGNGRRVFSSSTPSDFRVKLNTITKMRHVAAGH